MAGCRALCDNRVTFELTLLMIHRLKQLLLFVAMPALAQNNPVAPAHPSSEASDSLPGIIQRQTHQGVTAARRIEDIRLDCIQNRRTFCGKILKVLPDGLIVDSGYTNIMRAPLNRSWLVPGSVQEPRPANLVESDQPGCVCVGLVFLTHLPKKPVARLYDYVNLTAYPSGQYTYTSVGNIRRTVRRFSAGLANAIQWNLDESARQNQSTCLGDGTR
jgi:hypothetical protein